MFPVHVSQPGMQGLHAPNVCPEEPTGTTIFCKEHSSLAQERGYPMHVKEFLHYCGASQTAGKLLLQICFHHCALYASSQEGDEVDIDVDSEDVIRVNKGLEGLERVETPVGVARSQGEKDLVVAFVCLEPQHCRNRATSYEVPQAAQ